MSTLADLLNHFALAKECWYASVRRDGRVHLAPIWYIWLDYSAYVVTQSTSVRARNVKHNPSVSLSLPDPMNVLIIEGMAEETPQAHTGIRLLFQRKYDWDIGSDPGYNTIIRVTPTKLMAWGSHGEGRWSFDSTRSMWSPLR